MSVNIIISFFSPVKHLSILNYKSSFNVYTSKTHKERKLDQATISGWSGAWTSNQEYMHVIAIQNPEWITVIRNCMINYFRFCGCGSRASVMLDLAIIRRLYCLCKCTVFSSYVWRHFTTETLWRLVKEKHQLIFFFLCFVFLNLH